MTFKSSVFVSLHCSGFRKQFNQVTRTQTAHLLRNISNNIEKPVTFLFLIPYPSSGNKSFILMSLNDCLTTKCWRGPSIIHQLLKSTAAFLISSVYVPHWPTLCSLRPLLLHFIAATSQNDVIESADPAQPFAQGLANAGVGHVAGELAEAGVERRLERQEWGVRQ